MAPFVTIYSTTPNTVTWDVYSWCTTHTVSADYLARRKAHLVRTGGNDQGRVAVMDHMLDESQIDTLIAAIKAGA